MLVQITPEQVKYLEFLEKHKIKEEPIFINQNQAHKRFGRANVERWEGLSKIKAYYRPKSVQFKMDELLAAAEAVQDYDIHVGRFETGINITRFQ